MQGELSMLKNMKQLFLIKKSKSFNFLSEQVLKLPFLNTHKFCHKSITCLKLHKNAMFWILIVKVR